MSLLYRGGITPTSLFSTFRSITREVEVVTSLYADERALSMPDVPTARLELSNRLFCYTFPGFLYLYLLLDFDIGYCLLAGSLSAYVIAWAMVRGTPVFDLERDSQSAESKRSVAQPEIDGVVQKSLALYSSLPAHGKPRVRDNGVAEWTILASISLSRDGEVTPISLGTGVKCLPAARLPPLGDTLHDSHAEVLARRGFMRWLLSKAEAAHAGPSGFLVWDGSRFSLAPGVEVWLYVSALPVRAFAPICSS